MSAFSSPPPSLAPPAGRKRSLPFSLRIQTGASQPPPPFALGGISSPQVAIPSQGIASTLSCDQPPPSAIDPTACSFPPPLPALAPLPLPPHLRNVACQPSSPSTSSVPSLAGSPSTTPSTAASSSSSSSLPSLEATKPPRSGTFASRNPKNLSISLKPSWPSLQINPTAANPSAAQAAERKRSNSVSLVLPYYSHAYPEEEEPDPPYPNGPIEILPKVWLGHEGHARDVKLLRERGIGWVLNVAKEVELELGEEWEIVPADEDAMDVDSTEGRPGGKGKLRYMKLPWSHGQQDLCEVGFHRAMRFIDRALASGESVLVHCQCGVSRSATLVMALVIRAGHLARVCGDSDHPMCRIVSHNDAYEYVQGKSRWVGPNIVLINQLVEYSKNLRQISSQSPTADTNSRSRTTSTSTDLSQTAPEAVFSSDSSASSSPGLVCPPTPEGCASPGLGPESIEAMLLDKQMEVQYAELCQQRAAAAAALAQHHPPAVHPLHPPHPRHHPHYQQHHLPELKGDQNQNRGLGLSTPSPLTPPTPATPHTASSRSNRTRAASAESALGSGRGAWNIGMLLRVEEES